LDFLFNGKDLTGWTAKEPKRWAVADGAIKKIGSEVGNDVWDLWTNEQFGDFTLELDFKFPRGLTAAFSSAPPTPPTRPRPAWKCRLWTTPTASWTAERRGIYEIVVPKVNALKRESWNHAVITCQGPQVRVVINNQETVNLNLDEWITPGQNPTEQE